MPRNTSKLPKYIKQLLKKKILFCSPEDLDVKVEGNSIIITAKQEIQEAGGSRTRIFEQKFSLPSGVKAEKVKSSLTREVNLDQDTDITSTINRFLKS